MCGQYPITAAVGRVSIVMTNPTTVFTMSPEDSKDYSSTSKMPPDYTGFISGVKEDEPLIGGYSVYQVPADDEERRGTTVVPTALQTAHLLNSSFTCILLFFK